MDSDAREEIFDLLDDINKDADNATLEFVKLHNEKTMELLDSIICLASQAREAIEAIERAS